MVVWLKNVCTKRCPATVSEVLKRFHLMNCCSLLDKNALDKSNGIEFTVALVVVVDDSGVLWPTAFCCNCCCCCCMVARRTFSNSTCCNASFGLRTLHGGIDFPVDAVAVFLDAKVFGGSPPPIAIDISSIPPLWYRIVLARGGVDTDELLFVFFFDLLRLWFGPDVEDAVGFVQLFLLPVVPVILLPFPLLLLLFDDRFFGAANRPWRRCEWELRHR